MDEKQAQALVWITAGSISLAMIAGTYAYVLRKDNAELQEVLETVLTDLKFIEIAQNFDD